MLTAVAVGCVFYQPVLRVALYALLATVFTVIVQGAMDAAMAPIGIPTFTAPFVFVTWLFLLPKARAEAASACARFTNGIIQETDR